jgi:hypothetical protein
MTTNVVQEFFDRYAAQQNYDRAIQDLTPERKAELIKAVKAVVDVIGTIPLPERRLGVSVPQQHNADVEAAQETGGDFWHAVAGCFGSFYTHNPDEVMLACLKWLWFERDLAIERCDAYHKYCKEVQADLGSCEDYAREEKASVC